MKNKGNGFARLGKIRVILSLRHEFCGVGGRLLRNGLAAVESSAERILVYHNLLAMNVDKWYNSTNNMS